MVTRQYDVIDVDPSSQLVRVCAWCVPIARRIELHRLHRCSDGMCPDCQGRFIDECTPCQLEITYPSGNAHVLTFPSAFSRGLWMIAAASQPITMRILSVVLLVLAIAAPAGAEPKFSGAGVLPYVLVVAGQGSDFGTTARNYRRGFTESNPLYGKHPSLGTIALVKAGETAAIVGLMKVFEKTGHPKAARVLGYLGGIGGAIPAVINWRAGGR